MDFTIIDCYTDEPSGLGVPPYIGTYPRYIAGAVLSKKHNVAYLTIDDIRSLYKNRIRKPPKTDIKIYNFSNNNAEQILRKTDVLIVIAGVHTPGKYLSAVPGTVAEIGPLISKLNCLKILTGPAATDFGSGLYGSKIVRKLTSGFDLVIDNLEYKFNELLENNFEEDVITDISYGKIKKISILGTQIVKQRIDFPNFMMLEIETAKGCPRSDGCSFCTEPLKNKFELRPVNDIIEEVKALNNIGIVNFRLGKQSDFFARDVNDIEKMLKGIRDLPVKVLHIDNVDANHVTEEKTKLVVKYCTPGNVAALGVESFDAVVVKKNNINSSPDIVYNAIKIINKYGAKRGDNGIQMFLPGINIVLGLIGERKETFDTNYEWLKKILDNGLLLRRINIRQAVFFPGTNLSKIGTKYLKKNKKYYWKARDRIRQQIDYPMLQKLVPKGTVLKSLRTEVHDGNTTFCRQIGTYPLIVGVKKKMELNKFVDVKVIGHMLRSVIGEVV